MKISVLLCALFFTSTFVGVNSNADGITLRDAEINLINERLDFYRQKLELLNELRAETVEDNEKVMSTDLESKAKKEQLSSVRTDKHYSSQIDSYKKIGFSEYFRNNSKKNIMGERSTIEFTFPG